MRFSFVLYLLLLSSSLIQGQNICLDESFQDWEEVIESHDDGGDSPRLDIVTLETFSDESFLYFHLILDDEINLQDTPIFIHLDTDDLSLDYGLGDRQGRLTSDAGIEEIFHYDIGLRSSPTVSSREFEIQIRREWQISGTIYNLGDQVTYDFSIRDTGADRIPDTGFLTHDFRTDNITQISPITLEQNLESDFRICSYNVLRDNIFDGDLREEYARIFKSIDADIYCFQEIFDHSSQQVLSRMFNVFNALTGSTWHHSESGTDQVIISRHPIVFARSIGGNAVFVVNVDGQDVMIANVHFPCCENDSGRERDIDLLLSFIRGAKRGLENYDLLEGTPLIITGDTNFVGNGNQVTALLQGLIFNNSVYGEDFQVDWDSDGLTDLKPKTTGTNATYTWEQPRSSFSPGRLDYIFYSDSFLESINALVLDTDKLIEDDLEKYSLEGDDTRRSSDHLPVIADFVILPFTDTSDPFHDKNAILYPNPGSDMIYSELNAVTKVHVHDINGQLVKTADKFPISLEDLNNGTYLITIYQDSKVDNATLTQVFVKY